ncbi:hypothetical protein CHUAL_009667 [Chamberlinius hualienensis]
MDSDSLNYVVWANEPNPLKYMVGKHLGQLTDEVAADATPSGAASTVTRGDVRINTSALGAAAISATTISTAAILAITIPAAIEKVYIQEIVCGGAKNYEYKLSNGQKTWKVREQIKEEKINQDLHFILVYIFKGKELGIFFSKVFCWVRPLEVPALKTMGKALGRARVNTLEEVMAGCNVKEAEREHFKRAGHSLMDKAVTSLGAKFSSSGKHNLCGLLMGLHPGSLEYLGDMPFRGILPKKRKNKRDDTLTKY